MPESQCCDFHSAPAFSTIHDSVYSDQVFTVALQRHSNLQCLLLPFRGIAVYPRFPICAFMKSSVARSSVRMSHGWVVRQNYYVEASMNWDQVEGKWKQYSGKIKEKWGKLTDDDLTTISGKRDQLVGKLQERYGMAKDQAEKQIDEFTRALDTSNVQSENYKTHGGGR